MRKGKVQHDSKIKIYLKEKALNGLDAYFSIIFLSLISIEATIETARMEIIMNKDHDIGISNLKKEASILSPTKDSTKARPVFRYRKKFIMPAIAK